jgi:hypothetical protein
MIKKTIQELDKSLLKYYCKSFERKTESLGQFLLDSPTQYTDVFRHWDLTKISLGSQNYKVLAGLAVMSWYMTEEVRILLQLSLEEVEWPGEVLPEGSSSYIKRCYAWLSNSPGGVEWKRLLRKHP